MVTVAKILISLYFMRQKVIDEMILGVESWLTNFKPSLIFSFIILIHDACNFY